MKRERTKYEEMIVDNPQPNVEEKNPNEKKKKTELSVKIVEPPKVDEDTVVDVTSEYMDLENLRTKERFLLLHPNEMELEPNEVCCF